MNGKYGPPIPTTGAYAFNGWLYHTPTIDIDDKNDDLDDIEYSNPQMNFYHMPLTAKTSAIPVFSDANWSEAIPQPTDQVALDLKKGVFPGPGVIGDTLRPLGQLCIARHAKSVNVSFFDGHAENVKLQQLSALPWHAQWRTPPVLPRIP